MKQTFDAQSRGGKLAAANMTPEERRERARNAVQSRKYRPVLKKAA